MILKVKKLVEEAKLPTKATKGSVCWDVYSVASKSLLPRNIFVIPTGLAFELPEGIGLDIRPRSGLASAGLMILNSPGTLDSDYRGELNIVLINHSGGGFSIQKGNRIAQVGLTKVEDTKFEEVENLSGTERGEGGFGSSGK